jgi:hypothetical protein
MLPYYIYEQVTNPDFNIIANLKGLGCAWTLVVAVLCFSIALNKGKGGPV